MTDTSEALTEVSMARYFQDDSLNLKMNIHIEGSLSDSTIYSWDNLVRDLERSFNSLVSSYKYAKSKEVPHE